MALIKTRIHVKSRLSFPVGIKRHLMTEKNKRIHLKLLREKKEEKQ